MHFSVFGRTAHGRGGTGFSLSTSVEQPFKGAYFPAIPAPWSVLAWCLFVMLRDAGA